jgi:ribulose-5-phosphate 4-epimerase/fuculose-1-phosphate aldolase
MKFSGDIHKAMQMQQIQKDIMQIYSEARDKIGDPGDLTKLTPKSITDTVPAPTIPNPQNAIIPSEPVVDAGDERDELVDALKELYEKNLITATGGNLSVRVKGREDELWITPSALFKGNLNPNMMVRINMEGDVLDESGAIPSSEKWVHTEILKARSDMNAVIHTHSPWATLLALTETPFLPISLEAAFIGDVPLVPFIMPGTRELAIAVAKAMGEKGVAVLMQNHGLVVVGPSLRRATSTTEVVERYSELILRCLMLGKQPPVLPDEVVKSLREMGQMMA